MPPKKAQAVKHLAKIPPASAFKGKYKTTVDSPLKKGKKDYRHLLCFVGLQNGIVVMWLERYNSSQEEPFFLFDHQLLKNNQGIQDELGINAIFSRKDGRDGAKALPTKKYSEYDWKQFVFIVGTDNNTPSYRKELASKMVKHFNKNAVKPNYDYPRLVKVGEDKTQNPLEPVDAKILDKDVLGLMLSAYPTTPITEVATFDSIMKTFWYNIEHGREVVAGHAATTEKLEKEGGLFDSDDSSEEDE